MKNRKRHIVLAVIFSMATTFLLAGCGGSSSDTPTSGSAFSVVGAGKALAVIKVDPPTSVVTDPTAETRGYQPDCTNYDSAGILANTGNVSNPTSSYTDGTLSVDLDIYQLGTGGAWYLDWLNTTHSTAPIYSVFVDSSHGGYLYEYDGTVDQDQGLHAQSSGSSDNWGEINNIAFCYLDNSNGEGNDYQGCTLGYWGATKQGKNAGEVVHEASWPSPYTTGTQLGDIFTAAPNPDDTLLTALHYKGGPTLDDKKNLLLKQAVAALLSAAHPDVNYASTEAEIISQVNAALAADDQTQILSLQETLNAYNNMGCPLN